MQARKRGVNSENYKNSCALDLYCNVGRDRRDVPETAAAMVGGPKERKHRNLSVDFRNVERRKKWFRLK